MIRCLTEVVRIGLMTALAVPAVPVRGTPSQISPPPAPTEHIELSPETLGDLAMARQQYILAIEEYREAPKNSAEVWNKMGIAYHHLFAFDEAKRDYERALHLQPGFPEALNNLGAVYYAKKEYKKAEKYYRRSLRLAPGSPSAYSNLGVAYFAQGRVKRGLMAFRAAYKLDPTIFAPDSPQLVAEQLPVHERAEQDYCLAKLFAQSGHMKEAIQFLRRALDEGFDDQKDLLQDQTLATLRATPEFARLMAEQRLQK